MKSTQDHMLLSCDLSLPKAPPENGLWWRKATEQQYICVSWWLLSISVVITYNIVDYVEFIHQQHGYEQLHFTNFAVITEEERGGTVVL